MAPPGCGPVMALWWLCLWRWTHAKARWCVLLGVSLGGVESVKRGANPQRGTPVPSPAPRWDFTLIGRQCWWDFTLIGWQRLAGGTSL